MAKIIVTLRCSVEAPSLLDGLAVIMRDNPNLKKYVFDTILEGRETAQQLHQAELPSSPELDSTLEGFGVESIEDLWK